MNVVVNSESFECRTAGFCLCLMLSGPLGRRRNPEVAGSMWVQSSSAKATEQKMFAPVFPQIQEQSAKVVVREAGARMRLGLVCLSQHQETPSLSVRGAGDLVR